MSRRSAPARVVVEQPNDLETSGSDGGTPADLAETTFPHPHLRRVVDDVVGALTRRGGRQMVAVPGPPGVGKTKALLLVENVLCHRWRHEMDTDPAVLPVAVVEAPPPEGDVFPWREFLLKCLEALKDPAIDRLIGANEIEGSPPEAAIRPGRLGERELLRIAVRRYRRRRVRALLVDESQHITAAPGSTELRENLDILKSFANATGVRIALFGNYGSRGAPGVLDIGRASAQLGRRIGQVDFQRYRWVIERERAAFTQVARDMLSMIEGLDDAVIEASIEACYERTMGCVGAMHQWLVEAADAFQTTGMSWEACLAKTAKPAADVVAMLDEVEAAEAQVNESTRQRPILRMRLGLDARRADAEAGPVVKPPARRRVGRRKPTRDRVGPDA